MRVVILLKKGKRIPHQTGGPRSPSPTKDFAGRLSFRLDSSLPTPTDVPICPPTRPKTGGARLPIHREGFAGRLSFRLDNGLSTPSDAPSRGRTRSTARHIFRPYISIWPETSVSLRELLGSLGASPHQKRIGRSRSPPITTSGNLTN